MRINLCSHCFVHVCKNSRCGLLYLVHIDTLVRSSPVPLAIYVVMLRSRRFMKSCNLHVHVCIVKAFYTQTSDNAQIGISKRSCMA